MIKVIIKQAGPSKQYAWVGHQHYHNPGHDVPGHVFAAANLPKWTLMGSNIFQVEHTDDLLLKIVQLYLIVNSRKIIPIDIASHFVGKFVVSWRS